MVFFIVRGFSLFSIAAMTGVLWLQDHTKKVVVVKNATQTIFSKDKPQETIITKTGQVIVEQSPKKGIIQVFKETNQTKSEKLAQKHLIFGALSLAGGLLMPKLYFLLSIAYFAAYQLYYFAFNDLQFTPIWKAFIVAGGGLIGGKFLKIIT